MVRWEAAFARSISKRTCGCVLQYLPKASQMEWQHFYRKLLILVTTVRRFVVTQRGFFEFPLGKVDPGFSLELRQEATQPWLLLGSLFQRFLLHWAWVSTTQTKFVCKRNRERARPDESWASFAALYFLMESLNFHERFIAANIDHMKGPLTPDAAAPLVLCDKPKRVR